MNKIVKVGLKLMTFVCIGIGTYIAIDGVNTINRIDSM